MIDSDAGVHVKFTIYNEGGVVHSDSFYMIELVSEEEVKRQIISILGLRGASHLTGNEYRVVYSVVIKFRGEPENKFDIVRDSSPFKEKV